MAILTGAIIKAMFECAAKERRRFALNGIHVQPSGQGTRVEATDGRRLVRLDLPTNGTGSGYITEDHVKAMKAGDVVTIEGDTLTIHGAFPIMAKLSTEGTFPDTDAVLAPSAPWQPKEGQKASDYGYNPELLGGLLGAFTAILETPTVAIVMDGAKPMMLTARGRSKTIKHEAAQRAAKNIGAKALPDVGVVEIRGALMPLSLV